MTNVSENFADIEHGYITEKLNSWIETDLGWVQRYLEYYVKTGDPKWIDEANSRIKAMLDPTMPMQRELAYIEERRQQHQAALV